MGVVVGGLSADAHEFFYANADAAQATVVVKMRGFCLSHGCIRLWLIVVQALLPSSRKCKVWRVIFVALP